MTIERQEFLHKILGLGIQLKQVRYTPDDIRNKLLANWHFGRIPFGWRLQTNKTKNGDVTYWYFYASLYSPKGKRTRYALISKVANEQYTNQELGKKIKELYKSSLGIKASDSKNISQEITILQNQLDNLKNTVNELSNKRSNKPLLEKQLEDFIIDNFASVFDDRLILYVNENGITGRQFHTDVGVIDILAKEPSSNSFVVIELKRNRESDRVVGQISRYMGWVRKHLCKNNEEVKGMIICKETNKRLDYAVTDLERIEVKRYLFDFKLVDY